MLLNLNLLAPARFAGVCCHTMGQTSLTDRQDPNVYRTNFRPVIPHARLISFRGRIRRAFQDEGRPEIGVGADSRAGAQHFELRGAEGGAGLLTRAQVLVERLHELRGGEVGHVPQADCYMTRSGIEEGAGQPEDRQPGL